MQPKLENPILVQITSPFTLLDQSLAALLTFLPGLDYLEMQPDFEDPAPGSYQLILHTLASPSILKSFDNLKARLPNDQFVLLAFEWSTADARAAIQAGAVGCLTADMKVEAFAAALRQASRGEIALPGPLQQALILELSKEEEPAIGTAPALSSRETEVLSLLTKGLSNKEIAQRLYLSVRTVENHLANIYGKLGVNSRTEAAVLALQQELIPSD